MKRLMWDYFGIEMPNEAMGWCGEAIIKLLPSVEIYIDNIARSTAAYLRARNNLTEDEFIKHVTFAIDSTVLHELIHEMGETLDEEGVEAMCDAVYAFLNVNMVWKSIACPLKGEPIAWETCMACNDHDKAPECPLQQIRIDAYPRQFQIGRYHVSELWRVRNAYYDRRTMSTKSWAEYWDLFIGKAIGWFIEAHYPKDFGEYEFEVPLTKIVEFFGMDPDPVDAEITILGHADVVDFANKILLELKTTAGMEHVQEEAKGEHKFQLLSYYLLGLIQVPDMFRELRSARLVYLGKTFSRGKGTRRYVEHEIPLSTPNFVAEVRMLHVALKTGKPPNTECPSWMCRYCDGVAECQAEGWPE